MRSRGRLLGLISSDSIQRLSRTLDRVLIGDTQPTTDRRPPVTQCYKREVGARALDTRFDAVTGPYRRTLEAPPIAGALQVTGSSAGLAVVLWTLPDRTPFFLLYLLCQP